MALFLVTKEHRTITAKGQRPRAGAKEEGKAAEKPGLRPRTAERKGWNGIKVWSRWESALCVFTPALKIPSKHFVCAFREWGAKQRNRSDPCPLPSRRLPAPAQTLAWAPRSAVHGFVPRGRRTRRHRALARMRSRDHRALTRHGDRVLPARQGLLGADHLRSGVAHSRDWNQAVEELASPPGGREHERAAGRGAAGGRRGRGAERQPRAGERWNDCWRPRGDRCALSRRAPEWRLPKAQAARAVTEGVFSPQRVPRPRRHPRVFLARLQYPVQAGNKCIY